MLNSIQELSIKVNMFKYKNFIKLQLTYQVQLVGSKKKVPHSHVNEKCGRRGGYASAYDSLYDTRVC